MASVDVRKLTDIVIEMLAQNVSEQNILITLQQSGLSESAAKGVLKKAKTEFEQSLAEKLDSIVDKKIREKAEEKLEEIKKEFALQQDLKLMEQKDYTDKRVAEEKRELDLLKSELVSLKLKEETELRKMQDKIDLLRISGATQKMMSLGLMIVGLFSALAVVYFGAYIVDSIVNRYPMDIYFFIYVLACAVLAVVSFASLNTGLRIYMAGQKQLEKIGLEFLDRKRKEEEGSIQELVKEKDVV
ncbi:MAG: hypothetical protein QXO69_01075 [archaeon]